MSERKNVAVWIELLALTYATDETRDDLIAEYNGFFRRIGYHVPDPVYFSDGAYRFNNGTDGSFWYLDWETPGVTLNAWGLGKAREDNYAGALARYEPTNEAD